MKLDHEELKSACFDYAKAVMWERKPTDVSDIQKFADSVYGEAIHHVKFIEGQDRDPNLIIQCVQYLALKHAIPPMRDDIQFVRNSLEILIELACPNQGATIHQKRFFHEIFRGLQEAISDAESA